MVLVLGNYNNPVSYLDRQSRALMKLSVGVSSFSTFSSRAAAAWTTSLARNRFLKPKCTANVCTRMSFILKKNKQSEQLNTWQIRTTARAIFKLILSHLNLLADSSMTSRRFSLIVISIELNFCLTCLSGRLGEKTIKNIFSTTKSDRTNQIIKQP